MLRRVIVAALCCLFSLRAAAYSVSDTRWTGSSATLQLQLGASGTLSDGFTSWGASAEDAIALWNNQLASFRFNVVRDSTATRAQGNRISNVHFSADVYGQVWGNNVLAVTLTFSVGSANTETDVLFNNRLNWDSYRGPQRSNGSGQAVYDFHRVALHEFGHALGLDHPDESGQSVTALMNSRIGSLDTLAADDIAGAQSIYGASTGGTNPPTATAPVITTQPTSRTVSTGQSTTFTVAATSTVALTYQWLKNGATIAGATGSTYTIGAVTTADAGGYRVRVTNSAGSVTSNTATLTVNAPTPVAPTPTAPAIVSAPVDRGVALGSAFSLSVTASGTAPLTYQWRKDNVALTGATSATFSVASADASHAGSYTVVVSNSAGSVTSAAARITVGTLPVITSQPASQLVSPGASVTFTAAVTGSPAPALQWTRNNTAIPGATTATFTIASAQSTHEGAYRLTATNALGSVTSDAATLSFNTPPLITAQPQPQTVNAGARVQFTVSATSGSPISYQWLRNGAVLAGATTATLVFDTVRAADQGTFRVRLTNTAGSTESADAVLAVRSSRLVNLSTRAFVPPGGSLTPGFFVRGSATKPLLIRAVGPTLSTFGIGDAIGETSLELIAQETSQVVASNNDWGGGSALRNVFASVGAFPLAADSKDAAIETNLAPGAYTARIAPDRSDLSGITLAEVYDAESGAGAAQLVNVSTLGFVGTGENALTAGFVIAGEARKRVLIRAVGPGLAPFGVSDTLPDPQLGVIPLGGTEPLAANDDWPATAELTAAFRSAGAFTLNTGSRDAAVVLTLDPGAYTVVVSSVDGRTTGQALVEIYDLDL